MQISYRYPRRYQGHVWSNSRLGKLSVGHIIQSMSSQFQANVESISIVRQYEANVEQILIHH